MNFYRIEKKNYWKYWTMATLKSIGIALLLSIAIMVLYGYKFMIVISGSMEPTLPTGSLIIVTPCEYEDLELNDIVTMQGSGIYFTHRVVGKVSMYDYSEELSPDNPRYDTEGIWYTRGDNNQQNDGDGPINKEVIGKVYEEHCFTWIGEMVRYVKANWKLIIAFGVIFVVFVEVINYLKGKLETEDIECYETDEE
jgi:signal peptidase